MSENVIEFPGWRSGLVKGDKGQILATVSNAILLVEFSPDMRGMLGFDELAQMPVILRPPPRGHETHADAAGPYPRAISKTDVSAVLAALQSRDSTAFSRPTIEAAVELVAAAHRFHPIKDYLAGLRWDGKKRLDNWMIAAFDAPQTAFVRSVSAKILIAAVRRVLTPGCKFDQMLILEGGEGLGKSSCVEALAAPWFTDRLPRDLDSDNTVRAMRGKWIVEMSEIKQLLEASPETVRAFLSRKVDRLVPKYLNDAVDVPRACVLIGTTNGTDYLRDPDGHRRIWPVNCKAADVEWVKVNRDQLWAEAMVREAQGELDHLTIESERAEAVEQQSLRMVDDSWQVLVAEFLPSRVTVTIAEIMDNCLKIPRERHTVAGQRALGAILRGLGWERKKQRKGGSLIWVWERKSSGTT